MKNNPVVLIIIGILIGGVAMWFLATSTVNNGRTGIMGMQAKGRGVMADPTTIDAHFIEQMIPHHEDAITMAKLAQTKANTSEVKQLAEDIITSQSKEIKQMKNWYVEWFGKELPTGGSVMSQHGMMGDSGMHMGMMGDEGDLERLEQAEDFDVAFVEHMIPHHQMAVMMASMLKDGTQRSEMKKLADDIITAQTKEIEQMRKWLDEWR